MLLKISHSTGHVLANTKPHQLHWGNHVCRYIHMEFYKKHNHIFYFMISRPGEVYLIYSHKPEGVKCPRGSDCKSVTS